ncbi:MAG: hypothetical protein Q9218_000068 [Villophora microphyllina]
MGIGAYIARLALGRSAYEPFPSGEYAGVSEGPIESQPKENNQPGEDAEQLGCQNASPDLSIPQFDDHGRPHNLASRALSRRSRRAQNDVLATVGVIAGPEHQSTLDAPQAELQRQMEVSKESEVGFWISVTSQLAAGYVHNRMAYVSRRLQTFRFYAGVPFPKFLLTEWTTFGPSFFLFAGLPGDLLTMATFWSLRATSPAVGYLLGLCMAAVNICIEATCLSIVATLRFNSTLQGFGVLPLRQFFSSADTLLRLMTASFVGPFRSSSKFTLKSSLTSIFSVATSPVVLWFTLGTARRAIASKSFTYIRLALPTPDNPDLYSIAVAAARGDDSSQLPGLGFTWDRENSEPIWDSPTVWKQAKTEWAAFSNRLQSIASWPRSVFGGDHADFFNDETQEEVAKHHGDSNEGGSAEPTEGDESAGEDESAEEDDDTSIKSGEDESHSPDFQTDHMDGAVETTTMQNENEATTVQSELRHSANGYPRTGLALGERGLVLYGPHDESKPSHRVTFLSSSLVDSMAFSLSTVVANIILLPLETLFLRSVALTYLNTPGLSPASSHWLRQEVYPKGSWFGMGLRGGRATDYARKMVLCFGMEMALSYGVWQVGAGVTWWVGKWWFRWGKL